MAALLVSLMLASGLAATELERIPARDADQGVAVDGRHVYAVSNHSIARIDARSGREVARWEGDPRRFPHINSCTVDGAALLCAASNYPAVPMESRVEWFDRRSLRHLGSWPLGHRQGSLTWFLPAGEGGGWWACYANYDGKGGEPGRDHRATTLVRYDRDWRETGQWRFPDAVLARMAPRSASGGVRLPNGLFYVTGHDRPELYVLRVPASGDVLDLVATVAIPTDGQAIAIDPRRPDRLWSIERKQKALVASRLPAILGSRP